MDEKVREAQVWANATYGGVVGYQPCPENGKTGWPTMHSLIMGLQHELGISPVTGGFGPATTAKMAALGDDPLKWPNNNMVLVLRHGLFCRSAADRVQGRHQGTELDRRPTADRDRKSVV